MYQRFLVSSNLLDLVWNIHSSLYFEWEHIFTEYRAEEKQYNSIYVPECENENIPMTLCATEKDEQTSKKHPSVFNNSHERINFFCFSFLILFHLFMTTDT